MKSAECIESDFSQKIVDQHKVSCRWSPSVSHAVGDNKDQ